MSPLQRLVAWLARVTAVEVGKPNDGLVVVASSGTELDKPWDELRQEFVDALEAWRLNPLARRLVGLVTAYVVGDGIRVRAARRQVDAWLRELWDDPESSIMLEQGAWCDELTRSGELFLALFAGIDGRVVIRAIPASRIERIVWRPGDYRAELAYHEVPDGPGETGRVWYSPRAGAVAGEHSARPIMLHYAVNRPVGCVRGESDLRSILVWLRRYSRWVEDRVTLNSVVKSFVWVVKVPGHAVRSVAERYRRPPEAGSVLVVDRDSEEWQAVAPSLNARDAESDGRVLRWMVAAGGPGTSLVDLGEGNDANLAVAREMAEMRRRFLRRRQQAFGAMMVDIGIQAWNWTVLLGYRRGRLLSPGEVWADVPDISPSDNEALSAAASGITAAVEKLAGITGQSPALRRLALRLMLKFSGESVSEADFEEIIAGVMTEAGDGASDTQRTG